MRRNLPKLRDKTERWLATYLKEGPQPFRHFGSHNRRIFHKGKYPPVSVFDPSGTMTATMQKALENLKVKTLASGPGSALRWHLPGQASVSSMTFTHVKIGSQHFKAVIEGDPKQWTYSLYDVGRKRYINKRSQADHFQDAREKAEECIRSRIKGRCPAIIWF